MATYQTFELDDEKRANLENIVSNPDSSIDLIKRAKTILMLARGESAKVIAAEVGYKKELTVYEIKKKYLSGGIASLYDAPRMRKNNSANAATTAERLINFLKRNPTNGDTKWTVNDLSTILDASELSVSDAIDKLIREHPKYLTGVSFQKKLSKDIRAAKPVGMDFSDMPPCSLRLCFVYKDFEGNTWLETENFEEIKKSDFVKDIITDIVKFKQSLAKQEEEIE